MVEVIYDGNLGNNLFQYCFARILAEKLGYTLKASPINGFIGTYDVIHGINCEGEFKIILRGQKVNLGFLEEESPRYHILLCGYFQRYEYYEDYKSKIVEWLRLEDNLTEDIKDTDLVMGIRRGKDYIPQHGLPLSYFENALKQITYEQLYITTNDPKDTFVKHFVKKYGAIVREPDAIDNIIFIKKFKKIIISNSTFLWWAAYLSNATEIYYPRPNNGFWSSLEPISKNIELEVPETRYKYLLAEKYKPEFFREKIDQCFDNTIKLAKTILKKALFIQPKDSKSQEIYFHEDY